MVYFSFSFISLFKIDNEETYLDCIHQHSVIYKKKTEKKKTEKVKQKKTLLHSWTIKKNQKKMLNV